MKVAVNSMWSELGRDHQTSGGDILASVDQWTQSLYKELDMKTEETELELTNVP
jgi:hypothetical protein